MCPVLQDDAGEPAPRCSALNGAGPVLSRALRCPCSLQRLVPQLGERGDTHGSPGHPESHLLHLRDGDAAHTHPGALQGDGAGGDADGHPEEVRAAGGVRTGPRPRAHRWQDARESRWLMETQLVPGTQLFSRLSAGQRADLQHVQKSWPARTDPCCNPGLDLTPCVYSTGRDAARREVHSSFSRVGGGRWLCQLSGWSWGAGPPHCPPHPQSQRPQQFEQGLNLQTPVSPTSSARALSSSNTLLLATTGCFSGGTTPWLPSGFAGWILRTESEFCGVRVSVAVGAAMRCSRPRGSQHRSAAPISAPLKAPNPNHRLCILCPGLNTLGLVIINKNLDFAADGMS